MSKKKKKKIPQKQIVSYAEPTESEPQIHPDATLSPSASVESPTANTILQRDSTSAPIIGEDEGKYKYAKSLAGLADKHLFSKKSISFSIILIIVAIVSGFIFLQDNNAGLLIDTKTIFWTIKKCCIFFFLIFGFWIIYSVALWIERKIRGQN